MREAINRINRNQKSIVLITDKENRLIGIITDGDVRRALLDGKNLNTKVKELLPAKPISHCHQPVTASVETERLELLKLMQKHSVRQIPLVDMDGRVVDLVTLDEFIPNQFLPLQAVIMAGGSGTRLRPLTKDLPKPMLPVGGRPLMELILEQLREAGIRRATITTHYKSEKIIEHFGNGRDFGVELNYLTEDHPLGTAGGLGTIAVSKEPLLVINGDVLTKVNFRAMLNYHREHKADLTIAVHRYDVNVPYGVIKSDGALVQNLLEKPVLSFLVNAGIYLLEPTVHRYIPNGQHLDMTDLIQNLLDKNRHVVGFPILEYWLDIGHKTDYAQAQENTKHRRFSK
jgi:dTDP-glucose pyrophosphorylase